jgi:hypothetical protein
MSMSCKASHSQIYFQSFQVRRNVRTSQLMLRFSYTVYRMSDGESYSHYSDVNRILSRDKQDVMLPSSTSIFTVSLAADLAVSLLTSSV